MYRHLFHFYTPFAAPLPPKETNKIFCLSPFSSAVTYFISYKNGLPDIKVTPCLKEPSYSFQYYYLPFCYPFFSLKVPVMEPFHSPSGSVTVAKGSSDEISVIGENPEFIQRSNRRLHNESERKTPVYSTKGTQRR